MQSILIKKKRHINPVLFLKLLKDSPAVFSLNSAEISKQKIAETESTVFFLHGNLFNISEMISRVKDAGKLALVHIDVLEGFDACKLTVDFLIEKTLMDGILTSKSNILQYAKENGLLTIQRFFLMESKTVKNIATHISEYADAIEIRPGPIPKVIRHISSLTNKPIVSTGLISDIDDIQQIIAAGALAVSSSNIELVCAANKYFRSEDRMNGRQ